jgi:hypothetical protein
MEVTLGLKFVPRDEALGETRLRIWGQRRFLWTGRYCLEYILIYLTNSMTEVFLINLITFSLRVLSIPGIILLLCCCAQTIAESQSPFDSYLLK